jgi:hypothetical protein
MTLVFDKNKSCLAGKDIPSATASENTCKMCRHFDPKQSECTVAVPLTAYDAADGFLFCRCVNPDRDASECECYERKHVRGGGGGMVGPGEWDVKP